VRWERANSCAMGRGHQDKNADVLLLLRCYIFRWAWGPVVGLRRTPRSTSGAWQPSRQRNGDEGHAGYTGAVAFGAGADVNWSIGAVFLRHYARVLLFSGLGDQGWWTGGDRLRRLHILRGCLRAGERSGFDLTCGYWGASAEMRECEALVRTGCFREALV
jgi:hypothetical protein